MLRAKAGIGAESTVGAMFTDGDPLSSVDNSLAGVDFLYRNSRLAGGRVLEAGAWYQQSDTLGREGDDSAAGVGVSIPSNASFRGGLAVKELEANFNPALGFVSRRDVRDYSGHVGYTHRPAAGYWRSLYFVLDGERIENLDGGLQSQRIAVSRRSSSRTGRATLMWRRSSFREGSARYAVRDFARHRDSARRLLRSTNTGSRSASRATARYLGRIALHGRRVLRRHAYARVR